MKGGRQEPERCEEFRWVPRERLLLFDFAGADRPVAERLAREGWPAG
ncbi:MAG: hypothetical protein H5T97_11525 [Firmicutes bacterium]|nr:hypothetical protein [Bacillota bacterium]